MAVQSGNDDETVQKDVRYSPSSGRETHRAQQKPEDSAHLTDPEIDTAAVKSVPGVGGPDDAGDIDVDVDDLRERIARQAGGSAGAEGQDGRAGE